MSTNMDEQKKLKRLNRRLGTWIVVLPLFFFLIGWLLGSFIPMPFSRDARQNINSVLPMDAEHKFANILEIMSGDWFFAAGIDDVAARLEDQAYYGMTKNTEDPHTSYMSASEIESFTQSINRNFIGIGVQFYSTADGMHMVERVLRGTPAEKAGVQAGDIIHAVDGTNVTGMTSTEVADLVKGEEGTPVVIDFLRDGRTVTLKIIRGQVTSTTYGRMLENNTGYLQIQQFGESTGDECRAVLDEFAAQGVEKLVIDLRDDGGGYLSALQEVIGCFVDSGTTIMRQEYSDGTNSEIKSKGKPYPNIKKTVLLVNGNTASAAEVFTLAMKEIRPETVTVGTKTYGKGTVQITRMFDDGSGLKYTTSKWVSPAGVWVNGTGIEPDQEVYLDSILYETFASMADDEVFGTDSVSPLTATAQNALVFLGYDPGRTDGYLSEKTAAELLAFQQANELAESGQLDAVTYRTLLSRVVYEWNMSDDHDPQLRKALEVLND